MWDSPREISKCQVLSKSVKQFLRCVRSKFVLSHCFGHDHWRRSLLGRASSRPPTFYAQWANIVASSTIFLPPNWYFFHFRIGQLYAMDENIVVIPKAVTKIAYFHKKCHQLLRPHRWRCHWVPLRTRPPDPPTSSGLPSPTAMTHGKFTAHTSSYHITKQ